MSNPVRRLGTAGLGFALAIPLLAGAANPVSAVDGADLLIWQWNAPGARGLGLVKTGAGTLQLEAIGLGANQTVGVVLNSVGCARSSKPWNTLGSFSPLANAQGAASYKVELENVQVTSIKSVRLVNGNTQLDCGRISAYQVSAGQNGPMESLSLNFFNRNGIHFAVMVENDETHWVGHDFRSSREFEMHAAQSKCPNQPSAVSLTEVFVSSVKGTVYGAEANAVDPWQIRSFQIFRGSNRIMCGSAIRAVPV